MRGADPAAQQAASERALDWLLAMQSSDGGWAAFDADNNWEFLSQVPFADHNAMLDPTCAGHHRARAGSAGGPRIGPRSSAVRRGVDWLVQHQQPDGSWYGRWGVAYIYGTCFALRGLAAAGETIARRTSCAPANGCARFRMPTAAGAKAAPATTTRVFTPAESTPSQTAWAMMGLIAGGDPAA